jgi:DDE family transposase
MCIVTQVRPLAAPANASVTTGIKKALEKARALHFFNLLTRPELLGIVEESLPEYRKRLFPPPLALSMFLSQVLSADGSCQNALDEAIVHRLLRGEAAVSANTGGYCRARSRLPSPMIQSLTSATARLLSQRTPPEWLWRGRHVKLTDGTTTPMPDTAENQKAYPQHGNQKEGVGTPLARLVGVISLAHGAVMDVATGPCKGKKTGEHALFRRLLQCFENGDVMLADAYYCSFFLIAELRSRGVDIVMEQHGARKSDFRRGERLGRGDHVVRWCKPKVKPAWMSRKQYQSYPEELTLREVKARGKILVTSFLTPQEVSKRELDHLFTNRWHVELDLRNIKTTLGMDELHCKTPQMCEKEVAVYMLAYNLVRLLMAQAALNANVRPRQISFKHTLQMWVAWSQQQFLSEAMEDTTELFEVIAQIRVGNRPGRIEPRAIKRRPKAFPRLQTSRRTARARIRRYGRIRRRAA